MKKISVLKSFFTVLTAVLFSVVLVACESSQEVLAEAATNLEIGFVEGDSVNSVTRDVTLPTSLDKVQVSWETSNEKVVTSEGVVTRVYKQDQTVTLTATLTFKNETTTKAFDLVVVQLVDTIPAAFMGAIGGRLTDLKHLAGATIILTDGIQARDNVDGYDVEITVDTKDYNPKVAGTYNVIYTAADKSNNKTNIERTIIVEPSLDATLNAAVVGNSWAEFVLNDTEAFKNGGTYGATFRQQDKLQVMDKAFFEAELAEHAAEYKTENELTNGIPVLPYGVVIVTDKDLNVVHARFQIGVFLELNVVEGETVLTHTDVSWNQANTGVAGGSALVGLTDIIPAEGYVMFAPSLDPQRARIFAVANLFGSTYTGGAGTKDIQDVFDLSQVDLQLVNDYRVLIPRPANLETPNVVLKRHAISWAPVAEALSYQLYVNGEVYGEPMTTTSVDLASLELPLSEDEGYDFQVEAITKDIFKRSNSDLSIAVKYKKIDIKPLATPVISLVENSNVITWTALEGADFYEVYAMINETIYDLVGTTKDTSFDVTDAKTFNGVNAYYVKAIGTQEYADSLHSNIVYVDQTKVTKMTTNGMTTNVVVMTAREYFARRNLTNELKLGSYIFLVTDLEYVTQWSGSFIEAYSTVVILNSDYRAKVVRNILGKETYTKEKGWFSDSEYAGNGNQTVGFGKYVTPGDMLLIGKNGLKVSFTQNDQPYTVDARDYVAYHYVNSWETFPAATSGNGWRVALQANFDSSSVEFVLE